MRFYKYSSQCGAGAVVLASVSADTIGSLYVARGSAHSVVSCNLPTHVLRQSFSCRTARLMPLVVDVAVADQADIHDHGCQTILGSRCAVALHPGWNAELLACMSLFVDHASSTWLPAFSEMLEQGMVL